MIKNQLNLNEACDVVLYGRNSSFGQNDRSIEQQYDQIQQTINRLRLSRRIVSRSENRSFGSMIFGFGSTCIGYFQSFARLAEKIWRCTESIF